MRDRVLVGAGLVLFVAAAAFPLWHAAASPEGAERPELELPEGDSACVESTAYMRANHMHLLNRWRTAVVRDGEREYTATSGATFDMSLTGTCTDCHDDREAFCTRCHDFADVRPTCWSCHVEPRGADDA